MKISPKLLPWLARKAGLSQEKAEALWRETLADESITTQYANNPDLFFRRVLDYFQQAAVQQSASCGIASARAVPLPAFPSKANRAGSIIEFALA